MRLDSPGLPEYAKFVGPLSNKAYQIHCANRIDVSSCIRTADMLLESRFRTPRLKGNGGGDGVQDHEDCQSGQAEPENAAKGHRAFE